MRLDRETAVNPGTTRRSFISKLDAIDIFGLANELLARRGFTLDEGQPGKFQRWNRGAPSASKRTPLSKLPQNIRLELDHGRISFHATIQGGERQLHADAMMKAYAESLEGVLAQGKSVAEVTKMLDIAERGIKTGSRSNKRTLVSVAVIVLGAIVGAAMWSGKASSLLKPSDPKAAARSKSKNHTPPVITVRRAGEPPKTSSVNPE